MDMGARRFNIHNARTVGQKFEEKLLELQRLYPIDLKQNEGAWRILIAFASAALVPLRDELERLSSTGLLKDGRGDQYSGLPLNKKGVRRKPPTKVELDA
jgi:hypothetical protein